MIQRIAFLALFGAALYMPAEAQLTDLTRSRFSPAAYYNYAETGDVTIMVNVWGTVRNPGLYEIPRGTKLSTLFSLAGGPDIRERPKRNKRTIVASLTRGETGQLVVETVMNDNVTVLAGDPELQPGDVLTVESTIRQSFSWRDVFPIVAAVASVALAAERISSN
ncbi:MAG: hypothetical protein HKN43_10630 [Rhodothermales bacterium]|nr:hypothetical protein [Rhodothermales bacterium]